MTTVGEPGDPVVDPISDAVLAELEDYVLAGRSPVNPRFEDDPELRRALGALEHLHRVSAELIAAEARELAEPESGWVQGIMTNILREARAGRPIPLTAATAVDTLSVTEGAVRALIRDAGDAVVGVLIGRCELVGEITGAEAAIAVALTVSVAAGQRIPEVTEALRATVIDVLARHTELRILDVDIRVVDLHQHDSGTNTDPNTNTNTNTNTESETEGTR